MSAFEIAVLILLCVGFAAATGAVLYGKIKGKSGCCDNGTSDGKSKKRGKNVCGGGCSNCGLCCRDLSGDKKIDNKT